MVQRRAGPHTGCDNGPALSLSIDTYSNKITKANFSYDAAENLTASPVGYSYTWNAEGGNDIWMSFPATAHGAPGQAVAGGVTYTYTYNGDGQRVKKAAASSSSFDKLYWYGLADNGGSQVLAESALDGTLTSEYIFMGATRIARRDVSSGNVYYFLGDRLGNARIVTNATGGIVEESDFLPYGTERTIYNDTNQPDNNYKFTAHERDGETALDHTLWRQFSSTTGRWQSPDQHRGDPSDPQAFNRFTYVQNNPSNFIDPDGLLMGGVEYESPVYGPCTPGTFPTILPGSNIPAASSSCTIRVAGSRGSSRLDRLWEAFDPLAGIIDDWDCYDPQCSRIAISMSPELFGQMLANGFQAGAAVQVIIQNGRVILVGIAAGVAALADWIVKAAKDIIEDINRGRQTRCNLTGFDEELKLCLYMCDNGQPWAEGGTRTTCPSVIYRNW